MPSYRTFERFANLPLPALGLAPSGRFGLTSLVARLLVVLVFTGLFENAGLLKRLLETLQSAVKTLIRFYLNLCQS